MGVTEDSRGKALGILFGVSIGFALIIPVDDTSSSLVKLENRESVLIESTVSLSSHQSSSNPIHESGNQKESSVQPSDSAESIESTKTCGNLIRSWFYRNFIRNRSFPRNWQDFFHSNHFLTGYSVINEAHNRMLFVSYFWAYCGQQVLSQTFLPFASEVFEWSAGTSGIALTFIFLVIAVFSPLVLNYYYEVNLFGIGTIGSGIGYLLMSISGTDLSLDIKIGIGMLALVLIAFMGFYNPAITSMISGQYAAHKQGEVLSVTGQLGQLTSFIVYPTTLTFTAAISEDSSVYWPGVVFFVSAWYFFAAGAIHIKVEGWHSLLLNRRALKDEEVEVK